MSGGSQGWASNSDLAALAAWVRSRRRIVILTHVKPDGDALGSTLAVSRAVNLSRGSFPGRPAPATPWYWGPLPDWFKDIAGVTEHRVIDEANRADHDS